MKIVLRAAIGLGILAALGVALVPLLVLLDLADGGTGWGLCESGVGRCETSYFSGFELLGWLVAVLFLILGVIAVLVRILRWVERREKQAAEPEPTIR